MDILSYLIQEGEVLEMTPPSGHNPGLHCGKFVLLERVSFKAPDILKYHSTFFVDFFSRTNGKIILKNT